MHPPASIQSLGTGPDVSGDQPPASLDDEISAEAAADLYRDAIRLKRSEVAWELGALVVVLLCAGLALYVRHLGFLVFLAATSVVSATRVTVELVRLRRLAPMESWRRERREAREEAEGRAEHLKRTAAVKPIGPFAIVAATMVVTAIQFLAAGVRESIPLAALVKPAVRDGEWWRLVSAAFLHGNLMHLLGNMGALLVFGELVEAYDRRSRLPLVYLAAIVTGGLASTLATDTPSVGASGGILGLAGFVIVSNRLRRDGAPVWVRRQVLSMVSATAVLGIVAFVFIDNAAHLGGLAAGMALGRLSANAPPRLSRALDLAGWASALVLLVAAAFTAVRLLR